MEKIGVLVGRAFVAIIKGEYQPEIKGMGWSFSTT